MTLRPSNRLLPADRVPPARAIALALSVAADRGGKPKLFSETGTEVRAVLLALELAGWMITAAERK